MTDEHTPSSGNDVTIGGILHTTIGVVTKNFVVLFVLTAIFYAPSLVVQYLQIEGTAAGQIDFNLLVIGSIISIILQYALISAVTYTVYASLQGQSAGIGTSMAQGIRHMFPVILVSILATILMAVGLILLIVPGIIVAIMLTVAVPAVVVERAGIFGSLRRSAELTKGYRWSIFGLFVVLVVIYFVIALVVGAVLGFAALSSGGISLVTVGSNWLISLIFGMLSAALAPVIYFKLRVAKEGLDLGDIASVFD